jgi:hypothetical protein
MFSEINPLFTNLIQLRSSLSALLEKDFVILAPHIFKTDNTRTADIIILHRNNALHQSLTKLGYFLYA